MTCKNCNKPILKNAPFCSQCGAANEAFQTAEDRLDAHDRELADLKKKLTPDPAAAPVSGSDDSLI